MPTPAIRPKCASRRVRIEVLGDDQPEARAEHRTEAGDLQIDRSRRQRRRDRRERPVDEQQHGADRKRGRDERRRAAHAAARAS